MDNRSPIWLSNPVWLRFDRLLTAQSSSVFTSASSSAGLPPACGPTASCYLWLSFLSPLWELDCVEWDLESGGCTGTHVQTLSLFLRLVSWLALPQLWWQAPDQHHSSTVTVEGHSGSWIPCFPCRLQLSLIFSVSQFSILCGMFYSCLCILFFGLDSSKQNLDKVTTLCLVNTSLVSLFLLW